MGSLKKEDFKPLNTDKIKITELKHITAIKRVYSGKPGCACGCNGKYYPSENDSSLSKHDLSMFKRIYKIFKANLDKAYTWKDCKDKFICLNISETRTYTIYYV